MAKSNDPNEQASKLGQEAVRLAKELQTAAERTMGDERFRDVREKLNKCHWPTGKDASHQLVKRAETLHRSAETIVRTMCMPLAVGCANANA